MNNRALTDLLTENRKALQGLHAVAHMDFEQPFTIYEGWGNFTYKSIEKMTGKVIDTAEENAFIIYKDMRYGSGKFYLARLHHGKFQTQRGDIKNYETAHGWRWIDTIYSIGEFEKCRKNANGHYFVIIQSREFENRKGKSIPLAGRFREKAEYSRKYIIPYYGNYDWYYDNISGVCGNIDKSGYFTDINGYAEKLRKIRAEKSRLAAEKWDSTETVNRLRERIDHIKLWMQSEICKEKPCWEAIGSAARNIGHAEAYIVQLMEKGFTSMDNIEMRVRWAEKELDSAEAYM